MSVPDRRAGSGRASRPLWWVLPAAVAGVVALSWLVAASAALLSGHPGRVPALSKAPALALAALTALPPHPGHRRAGAEGLVARRRSGATAGLGALGLVGAGLAELGARHAGRRAVRRSRASRWARPGELAPVLVERPGARRVVLGRLGRRLVAVESGHSVLVLGPTQSGKTSGLAVPAILEWEGPVLATSVKSDLVRATLAARAARGRVQVFDPSASTGFPGAGWSPLVGAGDWQGARKVAAGLCGVARAGASGLDDAGFWYATAEKLLAPLLFAAAQVGADMAEVLRWVDLQDELEVLSILESLDCRDALQAARASFGREERQKSSVFTTAETVLAAFADPLVALASERAEINPEGLVSGGSDTLYVIAPAHEQERLQPVFVALVKQCLDAAFAAAGRRGDALSPPLLVVLDEAANVAPVHGLDAVAATAFAHGIQLVSVFQDFAQVEHRYGARAQTVLNNHRAKLLCSGVGDRSTLEQLSTLVGEEEAFVPATTRSARGETSTTANLDRRKLAPVDFLRRIEPGHALLLYGHLPPVLLALRPYYRKVRGSRRLGKRTNRAKQQDAQGFTPM